MQVRWAHDNNNHDLNTPYNMKLAAADQAGHVMVWDVGNGKLLQEFSEPGKPVHEMHWLKNIDAPNSLLLVLHAPGQLVLFNTETNVRLWRKAFSEPLVSFALDPFDPQSMALMSQEWIMFLHDLNTTTAPSDKGKKFYMTSNTSSLQAGGVGAQGAVNTPMKTGTSKSAFAKMRSWAGDIRGRNGDESLSSSECLQIAYSPTNKGQFLLLFTREILFLDLEFGQAIGSFAVENNSPSFLQIIPCWHRDAFFCLFENGSITLKLRRSPAAVPYQHDEKHAPSKLAPDIFYDAKCHSDVFRLSRLCRIMGFSVNPANEKEITLVLSDGRVLLWELTCEPAVKTIDSPTTDSALTLSEMLPPLVEFTGTSVPRSLPKMKFLLTGMFEGVASNPVCIKMCPALTTKNWAFYKPLAAVGCSNGLVQIFNVTDGSLFREVAVHATAVKGLEWFNLSTLLTFAHSSSGVAKSEIQMIDIRTGQTSVLPNSRGLQESHVACIRVSHQRQYFLVLFTNHHAELWDAVAMSQLREFPGNFPSITALEWSPSHYSTKLRKKHAPKAEAVPDAPGSGGAVLENSSQTEQKTSYTKEHLVFTNADGIVYHYVIEGTSMKDGSRVPPESGMSAVTFIAWKTDLLVLGDVDGNLNLWDLKGKLSRVFPSHRGGVKRMKFAPGKGNMKLMVLFADGIDIWEAMEATILLSLKTTKDQPSVVDADWLSSDMPLLLLSDGSVRALDSTLRTSNSTIAEKDLEEQIFLPRILPAKPQMIYKSLLQHQTWNSNYSLEFNEIQENEIMEFLKPVIQNLSCDFSKRLLAAKYGVAERCRIVAQILGDEPDFIFWTVAFHYLRKESGKRNCPLHKDIDVLNQRRSSYKDILYADGTQGIMRTDSHPAVSLLDISDDESPPGNLRSPNKCTCYFGKLDSCFEILCDNDFYQNLQLYRIALRDSKRSTPEQSRVCAGKLILVGETDRAVQILLEADPSDTSYYSDALRACLIATVRSSGASQSTIKLVATNLIANGKLAEGVELLCLVDKGVEACRYLQTYGDWELATWLAKVSLSQQDFANVMQRWVDHLASQHMNLKNKAVLVLLSLGDFPKALEIMYSLSYTDRRAVAGGRERLQPPSSNLYENIFLEYARLMHKLGLNKAVGYYCSKAGGRGRKLLEDLSVGTSPVVENKTDLHESTKIEKDADSTEKDLGIAKPDSGSQENDITDTRQDLDAQK
eukprot:gene12339-2990_t